NGSFRSSSRFRGVFARGGVGLAPRLAAAAHERLALARRAPGFDRGVISGRLWRAQMKLQAIQAQVPTDADRARPELLEVLLADPFFVRDVLERQPRALTFGAQPYVNPAH